MLELRLNCVLDLRVCLQVHRSPRRMRLHVSTNSGGVLTQQNSRRFVKYFHIGQHNNHFDREGWDVPTTRLSLTSARARLSKLRSPTLRFEPSLSIALSRLKRDVGVLDPSPSPAFGDSTRKERCNASHSCASVCS